MTVTLLLLLRTLRFSLIALELMSYFPFLKILSVDLPTSSCIMSEMMLFFNDSVCAQETENN